MAIEQGQELGKFLYKLAEAATKNTEAFARATARLKRSPQETLNTGIDKIVGRQKEAFKKSANDWVKNISSEKTATRQAALEEISVHGLKADNIDAIRPVLRVAIENARARGELPSWLPADASAVNNPLVAEFTARIALLTKDLQNDPYVLEREIARLSMSTPWKSLTDEARKETILVITNGLAYVRERVDELKLPSSEKVRFSQTTIEIIPSAVMGKDVRPFSTEGARVMEDEAIRTMESAIKQQVEPTLAVIPDGVVIPDPAAESDPELKNFWQRLRVVNGGEKLHPNELRSARTEIDKFLNKEKRGGGPARSSEQAKRLREFKDRITVYEQGLEMQGERFNTIYVSQEETQEFLDNFYLFFETRSREVEQLIFRFGYDSDLLQNKMRRNELLSQWFSHENFDDQLTAGQIMGAEGIKNIRFDATPEQLQKLTEMRQAMFKIKTDVLDSFHNRARMHEFYFALNAAADPFKDPRVQGAILALNDRGIFGAMKHYGSLADYIATQKLPALHKSALHRLSATINRRSTAEVTSAVRAEAVRQLKTEAPKHQATYRRHIEAQIMKLKGVVGDNKLAHMLKDVDQMTVFDDQLCESVVNLGWVLYSLDFRQNGTMNQFALEPGLAERLGDISSYRGSSWEDSFSQLWRPVSMHLRKYGDLTDANRVSLHGRARMYIYKDDRLFDACVEETDKLWQVIESHRDGWRHMNKGYFNDVKDHILIHRDDPFQGMEANPQLRAKAQEYIDLVKFRGVFAEYHNGLVLKGSDEEFAHFLTTIGKFGTVPFLRDSRDTLFNYVSIHSGIQLYERDAINPYGIWDSGVFRDLIERAMKLDPHWGKYFKSDYVCQTGLGPKEHGFLVGGRLLGAAGEHFNPRMHHFSTHEKSNSKTFLDALEVGAKTHPHELLRIRRIVEGMPMDQAQTQKFEKSVQMFGAVQHSLKTRGELPINLVADEAQWTKVQRQVFDEIFSSIGEAIGITKEEYLAGMRAYFTEVNDNLENFLQLKYARAFSTILWTDDVPLAELESPDLLKAFGEQANSMATTKAELAKGTKFSEQISNVGKARQSIFGITWLDHVVIGQNQLNTFTNTLSPDPKIATEAMMESDRFFFMYNSEDAAGTSLAANMAGFAEAAKNRFWRFFKNFNFSSYFRKTAGASTSPSFDVEDAETFIDKIQAVRGAVHRRVPACGEAMEEVAGITNWRSVLTGRVRIHRLPEAIRGFIHESTKSYTVRLLKFKGETFNKVVEWLNLYLPSGISTFKGGNVLIYAGLAAALFGASAVVGGEKEEGRG